MITEHMHKEIYNQKPNKNEDKLYVYEEQLLDLLKENNVDLHTIPSTRKGGGKPTKKDLITKLLQENIKPPQNWVAEIDSHKMDKSLVADIKKSIFLVDWLKLATTVANHTSTKLSAESGSRTLGNLEFPVVPFAQAIANLSIVNNTLEREGLGAQIEFIPVNEEIMEGPIWAPNKN